LFVQVNRRVVEERNVSLSLTNRAFLYGDALFETIKIIDGRPVFLSAHLARLKNSAQLLGLELPEELTLAFLDESIYELCNKNKVLKGGIARLTLCRKEGRGYLPQTNQCDFYISVNQDSNGYEFNLNGLSLGAYSDEVKMSTSRLATVKSANSLIYVLAAKYAQQKGLDEVIIFNQKKNVLECSAYNIFFVVNKTIYTPQISDGVLPGIMRKYMIAQAKKLGIEVVETSITSDMLSQAQEVFLTNAIIGIKWVKSYQDLRYFNKVSKTLWQELVRVD